MVCTVTMMVASRWALAVGQGQAELQLFTSVDHVAEHLIDGVGVGGGPAGHGGPYFRTHAAEERRRGRAHDESRLVREQLAQVVVEELGPLAGVTQSLLSVVRAQRELQAAERFGLFAAADDRSSSGDLGHQPIDVLELAQRRPALVSLAPARPGRQPDGEGLGEVLGRVRLGVPVVEVLDVASAVGAGLVVIGVGLGE